MESFRLEDLTVDPVAGTATRDGEPVALSDLSVRVLVALADAFPEPMDRDALAAAAWNQGHVSDHTLMQRIAMIRRELGDESGNPRYVRTVRHRGYALATRPEPVETQPAQARQADAKRQRPLRLVALAAIVAAVLVGVALLGRNALVEPILYDAERGALRLDTTDGPRFLPPVRASADDVDILILGLPDPAVLARHPQAARTMCALARGDGSFASAPPEDLANWLDAQRERCAVPLSPTPPTD